MAEALKNAGVKLQLKKNSLSIKGNKKQTGGNLVSTKHDHRIAMSFLCLGLISEDPIKVLDTDTINSSFPSFIEIMNKIGANLKHV